jgi:hypothetical protein
MPLQALRSACADMTAFSGTAHQCHNDKMRAQKIIHITIASHLHKQLTPNRILNSLLFFADRERKL